jgi:prepilin-type N-terminal cleavage/methylation domain-containing protein
MLAAAIRKKRRGFTLVELLVVVMIISILVAMLVPAVQSARETARRTSCQNNMRQIALGIMMYEQERQVYPPVRPPRDCPSGDSCHPKWGILTWILPFVEGMTIYDNLNLDEDFDHLDNEPYTKVDLPWTLCPSAPKGRSPASNCSEQDFGLSDYAAITRVLKSGISGLVSAGVIEDRGGADRAEWDGILQYVNPDANPLYDKKLTNAESGKDGLSNTFLFAEDAGRPELYVDPDFAATKYDADELALLSGSSLQCDCATTTVPAECPNGAPWASAETWFVVDEPHPIHGWFINITNHNEVYSFHPGGAVFAYGDGGVRYEDERMDPETFVRYLTRDDGRTTFRD